MQKPINPFIVALVVIGACAALLALILASVANNEATNPLTGNSGDPAIALAASVWAGLFAQVAILAPLGALVSAAVTWSPTPASASKTVPPVESSEMTDGERKFFTEEDGR